MRFERQQPGHLCCQRRPLGSRFALPPLRSNYLLAGPLVMGYPSALIKTGMDKFLPLIHPYVIVDHGEAHHLKR